MALRAGHGNDQRIIADAWLGSAPRGQIGQGVGPANADKPCLGSLPAVSAAAHPVIGVAETHACHAVLPAQGHGAVHAGLRIQIAGAFAPIPALQSGETAELFGLSLDIDAAIAHHRDEAGKAVDAVRIDAVASGLGEEPGTGLRPAGREAELAEDAGEGLLHFFKGDAGHMDVRARNAAVPAANPSASR